MTKAMASKPKTAWHLMPMAEVRDIANVLTVGALTHPPYGWKEIPIEDHYDAAMRHLARAADGEATDPETGASHFACAAARVLFCMWHEKEVNQK